MADDTIVAPATAPGEAAVAIVRLSGPGALALAARHFSGKRSPQDTPSHRILHGQFHDGAGAPIDTVLLSIFRAPHSYTGEDVVEVASHGGTAAPAAILDALLRAGARAARPGEFTERAFRNGKLDLAQAEAVAELIRARSDAAARAARAALGGAVSRRIAILDGELVALLAEVEARIDFPVEAGERLDGPALARRCAAIGAEVDAWLEGIPASRRRDAGVSVVLAGPPNVGKSSLLNALVCYDRAIVSDVPGTTRDTVDGTMLLDGIEVRLTDTAGFRPAGDAIERLGVERASAALEQSDVAVLVLDRSEPESSAAASVAGVADAIFGSGGGTGPARDAVARDPARGFERPVVIAWNKADLARRPEPGSVRPSSWSATAFPGRRVLAEVETVAIRPSGADPLRDALRAALPSIVGDRLAGELPATSARQEALLREARESLARAAGALDADASYDLIAVDLTEARRVLGEIIGRGVDQSVMAAIFARFCIGK